MEFHNGAWEEGEFSCHSDKSDNNKMTSQGSENDSGKALRCHLFGNFRVALSGGCFSPCLARNREPYIFPHSHIPHGKNGLCNCGKEIPMDELTNASLLGEAFLMVIR